MSGGHPPLTTHRRLTPGTILRRGATAPYRAIEFGAGEPHLIRTELGGAGRGEAERARRAGRALLCLARKDGGDVRLRSRTAKDLSATYPDVVAGVAAQPTA